MGRYFGREPRYSREEIERQAQQAIDARVSLGRPPDEDFRPLEARLAEVDRALAARPPVPPVPEPRSAESRQAAQPIQLREVRTPPTAPASPAKPAPARAPRRRVAAQHSSN